MTFLLTDSAASSALLQQRMVRSQPLQRPAAETVHARIADVTDHHLVGTKHRHRQCSTHAVVGRLRPRLIEDCYVGIGRCAVQRPLLCPVLGRQLHQQTVHDLDGQGARHLAGIMTAHAVGQHRKPRGIAPRDRVLVVLAGAADVAATTHLQNWHLRSHQ